MCRFELLGICAKGPQCPFAHGGTELRALPDLRCTKLCKALLQCGECKDPACSYAHSREELRSSGGLGARRARAEVRDVRKGDAGSSAAGAADVQPVLPVWKDATMPSPPGLSGWEGASGSAAAASSLEEATATLRNWLITSQQAPGLASIGTPYPVDSSIASGTIGRATLPAAVPPAPIAQPVDGGLLAAGAVDNSSATFRRTVEPAYLPLWPEGEDAPVTPLSRGLDYGGLGATRVATESRGTPLDKGMLAASPSLLGVTPLSTSTSQGFSPDSTLAEEPEDKEWEETFAAAAIGAANGYPVDCWNTWDSWNGWGGWGGWNGLGTSGVAEEGIGNVLPGSFQSSQQDATWRPGSLYASAVDASVPN